VKYFAPWLLVAVAAALGCEPSANAPALASAGNAANTAGTSGTNPVGGSSASAGTSASGGSAAVLGGGGSMEPSGAGGRVVYTGPGFAPTNVTTNDAKSAYEAWKAGHLEDCSAGVWRVRWETTKLDATVSEGMGYGMLLTVTHGDRTAFDGLAAYVTKMHDANGLMHWLRYGCDAHYDTKYSGYPDNAAADADLDVAMALLMAQCKWGDAKYGEQATQVINAIQQHMFADVDGLHVLLPGDSSWFHDMGGGCVNYSYLAPAYYREFAKHVPAAADFWNKAASDAYELLAKASNASTGLVRNWGSANGTSATADCFNAYKRADSYGTDAARTPWRIATDYLWSTTPQAKAWTDKVTTWVKAQDVKNVGTWYNLDGSPDMQASNWDLHTAITIGPFAVGAMTLDQATVDDLAGELLAIPVTEGSRDANYFPRMLKALSLVALTGQFTRCGGQ
jgi:endo-1,4-beta-D-glucanase Y